MTPSFGPEYLCLTQGGLRLEIDITPSHGGHLLRSPVKGRMSGAIRESSNAAVRVRFWEDGRQL